MSIKQHLKIMVVDDTSVSRMLICDGLDQLGLRNVAIAKDGEEALKMMMASPCHLVISDLNMPKLDGIQLLQALRQYAPTSKVGFVLVTGRGDTAVIDRAKKFGLNNYLPKPFTTATLKGSIESIVGRIL